jgi:hypothetical protein
MICCRMSALALAAIVAVCCQNSPPANAPIPDWVLYSGLFRRVCWQEDFGDRLDAAGKNSSFERSHIQKAAGLTVEEDVALKRISKDWYAAHRAYHSQRDQLIASRRANAGVGKTPDPNIAMQMYKLEVQHDAMIADHIALLKSALGARFQLLDNYVRTEIQPHMGYSVMHPVKPSGATKP